MGGMQEGCCTQGMTPLESPQPHSWCPVDMAGDGCSPGLPFSTITALGTVTWKDTTRPSLGCPHPAGTKNSSREEGTGVTSPRLSLVPAQPPCPYPPMGPPLPKLSGPLIHSFHPAIFWASEETKQVLTRYKAQTRKETGVGLGRSWRSCCVKGHFRGGDRCPDALQSCPGAQRLRGCWSLGDLILGRGG